MRHNVQFLNKAEEYINQYEPRLTQEQLIAEFRWVISIHQKFERYLRSEKIKFTMPVKSKRHLERRRLFMHWYINSNPQKRHSDAVKDLERLLMTTHTTIYDTLSGRR